MKILTITARRWEGAYEGGWELYDGDHILTQVTRLKDARQQASTIWIRLIRKLLTMTGTSESRQHCSRRSSGDHTTSHQAGR